MDEIVNISEMKTYGLMVRALKGAKMFYNVFLGETVHPKACVKWDTALDTEIPWENFFEYTKKIQEIKLRWFQIRINYRVLVTNSILKSMGIRTTDVCNFCLTEKDYFSLFMRLCTHANLLERSRGTHERQMYKLCKAAFASYTCSFWKS
jgi:hypothetical protein